MAKSVTRHPPPLRELSRRLARKRDGRPPPLFPLGLNPEDTRPAVTDWDYRASSNGGIDEDEARDKAFVAAGAVTNETTRTCRYQP